MFWKLVHFFKFLFSKKYRLFNKYYNNLVKSQLFLEMNQRADKSYNDYFNLMDSIGNTIYLSGDPNASKSK